MPDMENTKHAIIRDDDHREAKIAAAKAGMSLIDWLSRAIHAQAVYESPPTDVKDEVKWEGRKTKGGME